MTIIFLVETLATDKNNRHKSPDIMTSTGILNIITMAQLLRLSTQGAKANQCALKS
mgnify:CR=1 FL=1